MKKLTRIYLFLGVCIPLRLLLAYIPKVLPKSYLRYLLIPIVVMGLGTLYLALTNSRLNATEGGGYTWWANYRLIHAMLLLTASIYLWKQDRNAFIPLLMDVLLGILLFFTIR